MNKIKRNVYVVGSGRSYANWMEGRIVQNIEDADLVVFTGGEDINPSLYHEPAHPTTSFNEYRDEYEIKKWHQAIKLGKHIIGICRGAQLACALSGGKLIQDQENRHFIHPIRTYEGDMIEVSSLHHQAQWPWNLKESQFKLLGWSVGLSSFHKDGYDHDLPITKECEIVFYPETKALGIQGHPEMVFGRPEEELVKSTMWHQNLLDKHMNNQL
jgi:GMP synthase-like glutamine amidotransferase